MSEDLNEEHIPEAAPDNTAPAADGTAVAEETLTPIPEACASGIFARKAIKNVPTIAPSAVAM